MDLWYPAGTCRKLARQRLLKQAYRGGVKPLQHARALALALPEAVEQDHHGIPSFRVRGRIFATAPDGEHLRVMVDEGEIRACIAQDRTVFAEFWWGSRLACVVVDLRVVERDQLAELLADAWRRKAPRALVRAHDAAR